MMALSSFSAQRLFFDLFRALPALRFEEGVRRAKAVFHASRKFSGMLIHPK